MFHLALDQLVARWAPLLLVPFWTHQQFGTKAPCTD